MTTTTTENNNKDDDNDNNNTTTSQENGNIEFFSCRGSTVLSFPAHFSLPQDKAFLAPSWREETPAGLWHWASMEILTVKVKDNSWLQETKTWCVHLVLWKASDNHSSIAINHLLAQEASRPRGGAKWSRLTQISHVLLCDEFGVEKQSQQVSCFLKRGQGLVEGPFILIIWFK